MGRKQSVFSFNNDRLYKQVDGCGIGNLLSPVLANIFMVKLESDIVAPSQPTSYLLYVDDCFSIKEKNQPDPLLKRLNSYHPNIQFTYNKPGKIPTHWNTNVPSGKETASQVLYIKPNGFRQVFLQTNKQSKNPYKMLAIYILAILSTYTAPLTPLRTNRTTLNPSSLPSSSTNASRLDEFASHFAH